MARLRSSGKVAIVTGGASGIGEACSETLAREGAAVLITDIDDALGKDVVAAHRQGGRQGALPAPRRARRGGWPGVIAEAEKRFGRLDIMVANAGIGIMAPIADDDARRLAAPAGDQPRRRVPVDQACHPGDEARGRRLDRADVVGRGPARCAGPCRLFGDQGRRAAARQVGGARTCRRQHPLQLGASRHHRHADLGQDPDRRRRQPPQRADRSARARRGSPCRCRASARRRTSPTACCSSAPRPPTT